MFVLVLLFFKVCFSNIYKYVEVRIYNNSDHTCSEDWSHSLIVPTESTSYIPAIFECDDVNDKVIIHFCNTSGGANCREITHTDTLDFGDCAEIYYDGSLAAVFTVYCHENLPRDQVMIESYLNDPSCRVNRTSSTLQFTNPDLCMNDTTRSFKIKCSNGVPIFSNYTEFGCVGDYINSTFELCQKSDDKPNEYNRYTCLPEPQQIDYKYIAIEFFDKNNDPFCEGISIQTLLFPLLGCKKGQNFVYDAVDEYIFKILEYEDENCEISKFPKSQYQLNDVCFSAGGNRIKFKMYETLPPANFWATVIVNNTNCEGEIIAVDPGLGIWINIYINETCHYLQPSSPTHATYTCRHDDSEPAGEKWHFYTDYWVDQCVNLHTPVDRGLELCTQSGLLDQFCFQHGETWKYADFTFYNDESPKSGCLGDFSFKYSYPVDTCYQYPVPETGVYMTHSCDAATLFTRYYSDDTCTTEIIVNGTEGNLRTFLRKFYCENENNIGYECSVVPNLYYPGLIETYSDPSCPLGDTPDFEIYKFIGENECFISGTGSFTIKCNDDGYLNLTTYTSDDCFGTKRWENYLRKTCKENDVAGSYTLFYCTYYCDDIIFYEHDLTCSGNGECIDEDECECVPRYNDQYCDRPDSCNFFPYYSNEGCVNGVCNASLCVDGDCECSCNDRWSLDDDGFCTLKDVCNGVFWDDQDVCSGNGVCNTTCIGRNCSCDCNYRFFGINCESSDECNGESWNSSTVCSGNGECGLEDCVDHVCECSCNDRYHGSDCEDVDECNDEPFNSPTACSDHGVCTEEECVDYICECNCDLYWNGDNCDVPNKDEVCNEHGNCSLSCDGENCLCDCEDGFGGDFCKSGDVQQWYYFFEDYWYAFAAGGGVLVILIIIVILVIIMCIVCAVCRSRKNKKDKGIELGDEINLFDDSDDIGKIEIEEKAEKDEKKSKKKPKKESSDESDDVKSDKSGSDDDESDKSGSGSDDDKSSGVSSGSD